MSENTRIEYKRELTDGLEKEVIAFLNYHGGGTVYIGVDKMGQVYGLQDADGDVLKIKDRLKHNITPSCLGLFDLNIEERGGQSIIRIIVASGIEKPYHLTKYGMTPKGTFIRIGTASEPMELRMIDDLFARRTRNSIGRIKANRQDLTFRQLKIYYEGTGVTLNEKFAQNLELQTENGDYNYLGYLLADDNAVSIKVAKYAGTDKIDLIENEEYGYCSLIKATHRVLDKLEIENKTFAKITGAAQRKELRMIDKRALREALINAMVHNDYTREVPPVVEIYSDRLSITSYGGLVNGLSRDEFFEGRSMPRNRELMRIFKDLQLVENLGSGVYRILNKYKRTIFKITENFIEICFPYDENYQPESESGLVEGLVKGLVESQQRLVKLIAGNPKISKKEMANVLGISITGIDKSINSLKEKGIIKRIGSNSSGHWEIIKAKGSYQPEREIGLVDGLVTGLVESQQRLVKLIAGNPKISKKEMAAVIGISTTGIDKSINSLKEKGIIKRIGSNSSGHWEIIKSEGYQPESEIGLVEGLVTGLVESQQRLVNLIAGNPKISKKEMAAVIGISTTGIDKSINSLKEKGIIKRVGSNSLGHWEIIKSEGYQPEPKIGLVEGLVESQQRLVKLIAGNPKISKKEMAAVIGISTTGIDKSINSLKEKGIIKRVGSNSSGHWEIIKR